MKKGTVFLGLLAFISVFYAASLNLYFGDMQAQVKQKVVKQKEPPIPIVRPTVTSVTPQKAVLAQGGDPVVVEAQGTDLQMIGSVQVIRGGVVAPEIEASLDQSQLPTTLKVSLKAASTAQIANDYQLALLDGSQNKVFDVPTTVLAIEVQSTAQKAVLTQKTEAAFRAREREKVAPLPDRQVRRSRQEPSAGAPITSAKVQGFLKDIQAAQSLNEIRSGLERANFSQSESDLLRKELESSPLLRQRLDRLSQQEEAKIQARYAQFQREASAKIENLKSQYLASERVKAKSTEELMKRLETRQCLPSDEPVIDRISGEPIEPGVMFIIAGKGFGSEVGIIHVYFGGHVYVPLIDEWKECSVHAHLSGDMTAVRPSKDAMLVLQRRPDQKQISRQTSFQPILEFASIPDNEEIKYDTEYVIGALFGAPLVDLGESKDWTKNDFTLKNDWFVKERVFSTYVDDGHAEITYASEVNVPNGSARTSVHAGREAYGKARWWLRTILAGPRGLTYN